MRQSWTYSLVMLVAYIGLFLFWLAFPSRGVFLLSGSLVIAGLVWGYIRSAATKYFVSSVDARLHALVILDVIVETVSFECFRLFKPMADVDLFHNNTNFIGCSTAFTLLIGCYRYYAMSKRVPVVEFGQSQPQT